MFDLLIDSQDIIYYQLFCELKKKNPQEISQLVQSLKCRPSKLKERIKRWQESGRQREAGVAFIYRKKKVRAVFYPTYEQDFLSILLHRSITFQFLLNIIKDPYACLADLAKEMNVAYPTLSRKKEILKDFLKPYCIEISFKKHPILKGDELQIRWFLFLTSLIVDPPIIRNGVTYFNRYQEVHQFRITQGFRIEPFKLTSGYFSEALPFKVEDRSLLFLWKQLTGVEPLWLHSEINDKVAYALGNATDFSKRMICPLQSAMLRLLFLSSLFEGPILTYFPLRNKTNETGIKIDTYLNTSLEHYAEIAHRHPELPTLYQHMVESVTVHAY